MNQILTKGEEPSLHMSVDAGVKARLNLLLEVLQPSQQMRQQALFTNFVPLAQAIEAPEQAKQSQLRDLRAEIIGGHILHVVSFVENDVPVGRENGCFVVPASVTAHREVCKQQMMID